MVLRLFFSASTLTWSPADNDLPEECVELLDSFAYHHTLYSKCLIRYSVPAAFCLNCVKERARIHDSVHKLRHVRLRQKTLIVLVSH